MKKISNFFKMMSITSLTCFLGSITTVGLKNNDVVSDKKQCKNSINENKIITKKIDAKLIGADKGTITIEYTTPSECKITDCSLNFLATGDFNFNGGKFVCDGVEYTIVEIGRKAFCVEYNWNFLNCNLTIPSTIKKICSQAFCGNSPRDNTNKEIISINFEEGVEYIGPSAFASCSCEKSNKLVLPNSIKCIDNNAFAYTKSIKELDLTALDHVISIGADPFKFEKGFLYGCSTEIIRFKDQTMKDKYSNSQYWSSVTKYFYLKGEIVDTISSKYIGANEKSTFDFRCLNPNQTKITGVSWEFIVTGNFNFNGGKFTYDGTEYVISEIAHDVFKLPLGRWYFKKCNLTIPSTIKKIGDRAFYWNSRNTFLSSKEIIGLNFEEGIEDIGKEAFKKCDDLQSSKLVLPNSLQHIGNNAFEDISPLKELDLSALDHVINIDANPFGGKGCLFNTKINKIWLKDETIKEKYCSDKYWSSVAEYFVLKDHIYKTINSKYIGGDSNSTFDFNYFDPKQTKISGVSSKFVATGNFNFNGGKFTYDGTEHVISEIGYDAFHTSSTGWYFKKCNLTIPASIKKIRDGAFYWNSRYTSLTSKEIIGLNFEEGIEDIGKKAFSQCDDLESDKLVLPNSLQHIGNNAFEYMNLLKELDLDLSALDHVINIDANPFDLDGFLHRTNIKTIWVKDQAMKDKYCKDQFWSSATKYFQPKDHISKTINSKYIGGDSNSTFDFSYFDPKQTKITGVSSKFVATGNFNFNGGKFTYNGTEYVISEIAYGAFQLTPAKWYFKECNLTIPASIKKIRDSAFYGNSRNTFLSSKEIIGLSFEEGIEDIGKKAFYKCDDLESNKLFLPNSLQHIGNNAFAKISPLKELDLSALDHVINIDADPFGWDGCLYDTKIDTIWVKDQTIKGKYCNDQYWSSAIGKIKVKS